MTGRPHPRTGPAHISTVLLTPLCGKLTFMISDLLSASVALKRPRIALRKAEGKSLQSGWEIKSTPPSSTPCPSLLITHVCCGVCVSYAFSVIPACSCLAVMWVLYFHFVVEYMFNLLLIDLLHVYSFNLIDFFKFYLKITYILFEYMIILFILNSMLFIYMHTVAVPFVGNISHCSLSLFSHAFYNLTTQLKCIFFSFSFNAAVSAAAKHCSETLVCWIYLC